MQIRVYFTWRLCISYYIVRLLMYNSCIFLDLSKLVINIVTLQKHVGQGGQILFFLVFLRRTFPFLCNFDSFFSHLNYPFKFDSSSYMLSCNPKTHLVYTCICCPVLIEWGKSQLTLMQKKNIVCLQVNTSKYIQIGNQKVIYNC